MNIPEGKITSFCSFYILFCETNKFFLFKKCALSFNISMMKKTVKRASQLRG